MNGVLLQSEHRWTCPNCDFQDITREVRPHTRMHRCRGLAGLLAPMVPAGTKCKAEVHVREDYIGKEIVRMHEGRPVMNVQITRDDGEDCAVFAPTATAGS